MLEAASAHAGWWSITEVDGAVLGAAVAIVAVAAVAVLGFRLWSRRR
jgi:hypothetical protein